MRRVQEMSEIALAGFPDSHKQQLAVFAFCRGMIDDKAAQLVMLHAKNQVHKAVRTATSFVNRTSLSLVPEPPPPPPAPPTVPTAPVPRQSRAPRYQTYAAVEQE